jgi:hypothetical protein
MGALPIALVWALVLASCGSSESSEFPRELPSDALVGYVAEGGIAGSSDYLVVHEDGSATLASSRLTSGEKHFRLSAQQLSVLRDRLDAAGLDRMESDTSADCCDLITT